MIKAPLMANRMI